MKVAVCIIGLLAIIASICGYAVLWSYQKTTDEIMEAPNYTLMSPFNLASMGASLQSPIREAAYEIPAGSTKNLKAHIKNISAEKGWFVYQGDHGMGIVLPESDMYSFEALYNDPVAWVLDHGQNSGRTVGKPSSQNLVNANLRIYPSNEVYILSTVVAVALGVISIGCAFRTIYCRITDKPFVDI